jgi:hypothetical protein
VLLGVLVTLGVIILLATPGPWHRVVPAVAKHPPLAPAPPPRDIAVFVNGPGKEGCAGVVWLHVDIDLARFTAVVVPARLTCELPGAGLQPLAEIADQAGPKVAARALGKRLSVMFGSWITVDPLAVRAALPGFITIPSLVHGRAVPLAGVWATNQSPTLALRRQVHYLRSVLKNGLGDELSLVGFVNYILGSTDVSTALKLQAASTIGAALNATGPGDLVTSSLPVTVDRRGRYQRWLPATDPLLALRQSFAFDATSPIYEPTVQTRPAGHTVLVLTAPLGRRAATYRVAFARALRGYGVRGVVVRLRSCASAAAVGRALAQSGTTAASLGVVVALGRPGGSTVSPASRSTLAAALAGVRADALPAIVSEVPGAGAAVNHMIAAQAAGAGLPLSPVAALLTVAAAGTASPAPTATPSRSPTPGGSAAPSGSVAPVTSTTPDTAATPATGATPAVSVQTVLSPSVVARWARLDAATFVRVVQPAFFAPRLAATRLGVSYYERTLTRVAVVGSSAIAARLAARLDVMGYAAQPASTAGPRFPAVVQTVVYYTKPDKRQALALAGDLGLPAAQIAPSTSSTSLAPLTVVLPG